MDVRLDIMHWAVSVHLISNAPVSNFQSALNSGTVKNVTSVRSGTRVTKCALVSLDLECQAHDALPFALSLLLVVSSQVGVSIPPKVNP